MSVHPAPAPSVEVLYQKPVKPKAGCHSAEGGQTPLSCLDAFVTGCSARAWGFPGAHLDERTLEAALQATVTDMPLLAGRLRRLDETSLGTLHVDHTGDGAQLTVVECREVSLAEAIGPDSWCESGFTLAKGVVPLYLDYMEMEGGQALSMMAGKVPLLMVRLTHMRDGCILGVSAAHFLKDGTRWPMLMNHLAARYRQLTSGIPPDPSDLALLQPTDRLAMTAEGMAAQLGLDDSWRPPPRPARVSLLAAWRSAKFVISHTFERRQLMFLHLPPQQVAELKRLAAEGRSPDDTAFISTGDAVQAAAAMLQHAALGQPLLPAAPRGVAFIIQPKMPPGYFGNATVNITARPDTNKQRPAADDYAGILQQLARAIRQATVAFRATLPLAEMHEFDFMVRGPFSRLMTYWYGEQVLLTSCLTNYVPKQQDPDFGVGAPAYDRELTNPRTRDMVVIRAACAAPYSDGLLIQLCLTARQAARLRAHPLLQALLPGASWVGSGRV